MPQAVKELGPLWANTCYEFENANAAVKKLLHGTNNVHMQIAESVAFVHFVHSKMSQVNDDLLHQCCFLKTRPERCHITVDEKGIPTKAVTSNIKQLFMLKVGKISSREYKRSQKIADYAVQLDTNQHCLIEQFQFIRQLNEVKAIVRVLDNRAAYVVPHLHKYLHPFSRYHQAEVSLSKIKKKCIIISTEDTGSFYIGDILKYFSSD
ncbi:PREDICTED: uncharacterized protein LOC109591421 [Amphimedon queenslandica]|uniref:Uncharacterized protein n=1 Tax=Amphimedon queenslandica TaxID=400682 RepID=A0AAN0K0D3_AMPQE|nr:PREDICTED: uncharacterized protein LOC109591421 [Amphimedon queenslandica]|eukprot:XP_019862719.1 PREDICTED: uncharacterized protein LOC109591421 [Amphimedon queenslandica]